MIKFIVGESYYVTDWFCGGRVRHKCISRTDESVTFDEYGLGERYDNTCMEKIVGCDRYPLEINERGDEVVQTMEYKGHKQYMGANKEEY